MNVLTFATLAAKPGVFKSMTGISTQEFEALLARVGPRYEALIRSRIERADRQRAPGGGEKSSHDLTERLLMTLVWLRLYLTCEAVGFLFGVDKGTVSRFTRPILLILRDLGVETLGWPDEAITLAQSANAGVPLATPTGSVPEEPAVASDVEDTDATDRTGIGTPDEARCGDHVAIIDATEQRVERPGDSDTQKTYYSGKKKAHTLKTQIVVNERGRMRQVSDSVPGATHDLTLLRQSGVVAALPRGVTANGDCGYRGMQNDFPDHSVALPYRPNAGEHLTPEEKLHNQIVSSVRIVVENTLAELKHFQALASRFRHSLERHSEVIKAIVGIVNRRIDQRLANLPIPCSTTN